MQLKGVNMIEKEVTEIANRIEAAYDRSEAQAASILKILDLLESIETIIKENDNV